MLTISDKFLKEAALSGNKPTAVIGFVKETLSTEATYKSHWQAALSSSNIEVVGNEVHLAKTLSTAGVLNDTSQTQTPLFSTNNGYVWSPATGVYYVGDDVRVLYQSFVVPVKGYLQKIRIPFSRSTSEAGATTTIYIAITDANEVLLEAPVSFATTSINNPKTWLEADFSGKYILLETGKTYKIMLTQSSGRYTGYPAKAHGFVFASTSDTYAGGSLRQAINQGPSAGDAWMYGNTINDIIIFRDMAFEITMNSRYQSSGNISIKLDLGQTPTDNGEWVVSDVRDNGTNISYQAWASDTGAFAGEETSLGTIQDGDTITVLKRYYKITSSLTASTDNLTTPKILKIKANFDKWDRYCLKDSPLEWKGIPFPPIVNAMPQLQYQMDIMEGKASISKVSVDFLDEGFLEDAVVNYYLKNNEIVIYIGYDANGWTFGDYIPFWRGNIANWKRKSGIITLECSDWAALSKKEIPEEQTDGTILPLEYSNIHPIDIETDILQNKINMRDSQIHLQSFTDAKASSGLSGWKFRRTITKPQDAWKLIQEINILCGCVMVPREDGKLYLHQFSLTAAHVDEFGDDHVKKKSLDFNAQMSNNLINQAIVYYGFHTPLTLSGTVTWTQNNASIVGSGTQFVKELSVGMEVQGPDNRVYKIKSIASDTSAALENVYTGATASGPIKRPRTEGENEPSSYEGAVVVSDAPSILNYKQTVTKRILPNLWLGPDDATYAGKTRATDIGNRIISWAKNGIAFANVTTTLEFVHLQTGDFIRLGSKITLPRNLLGFAWTKWAIISKTIDFSSGQLKWGMLKVPSGTAFSDELLAYSDWLNAAYNLEDVIIDQWPTEVILNYVDDEYSDKLQYLSEWQAYQSQTNLQFI